MKKTIAAVLILAAILLTSCSRTSHVVMQDQDMESTMQDQDTDPLPVKVLILPKLEVGDMTGDFPGEAQYYYEQYLTDAEEYDIPNGNGNKLYYKDGVALYVLGMGKVNAALGTMTVLSDNRFDFSQAYIIATGCSGSAIETTVMGDVFIITSAVDFDLGHHADSRGIADSEGTTWFHDASYDSAAVVSFLMLCFKIIFSPPEKYSQTIFTIPLVSVFYNNANIDGYAFNLIYKDSLFLSE